MPYPLLPNTGPTSSPVDVDVTGLDLALELGTAVGDAGTLPGTDSSGFVVKVVNKYGALVGELPNATDIVVDRILNAEPEISFASPKYDPATLAVELLKTEVQVSIDGDLKAWGPVIGDNATSADGKIPFSARGPYWYLRRRYFGSANRRNSIVNGDFEHGPAAGTFGARIPGWAQIGGEFCHYRADTKPAIDDVPDPFEGTRAVITFEGENSNVYLRSRWAYRTEHPPGQRVTVAAWVYLVDFTGPAAFGLGLYAAYLVAGNVQVQNFDPIDPSTARGKWVRLETSIIVPPRLDGIVEVRLYAPGGVAVWDASRSALMESTSSAFAGTDQALLAAKVVRAAQYDRGKSPLNIGTRTPTTGVLRRRSWQHADHQWTNSAIEGLAGFPDGFDFRIDVTPRTRTFRTFFPRAGVDRREDLTLELGVNVASYSRPRDGASVSTSVVSRLQGSDGPTREEGLAQDASALSGLILDELADAPDEVSVDELDEYAEGVLAGVKDIVTTIELVIVDADLIALLEEPGDLVRVVIDDGYVQVDGDHRIVKTSRSSATPTAMAVTVNPWED